MAATTTDKMYQAILVKLKAVVSLVHDDFIYISHSPLFAQDDDQYIQLIPGIPTSITSEAGIYLIEEEFEVAVWSRLYLDQGTASTERFANITYGIQAVMTQIRSGLLNHMLSYDSDDNASLPVTYLRGSKLFETDENPGWCYLTDTYRFGYEIG
tara:strand:- start:906 stop:1370 length:465 start_codon:yes stop_codon:yes gene_type:complete